MPLPCPTLPCPVECHLELVHAEINALMAFLCVVGDQSLMGFVDGALHIRTCFSGLRACERLLRERRAWTSGLALEEFRAGVTLWLGFFDMSISFLPAKLIKLLELAGFSGDRNVGMEQIEKVAKMSTTIRHLGGLLAVATYHGFLEFFFCEF